MSLFFPYSPDKVIEGFTNMFSLDLLDLTDYQTLLLCIGANVYFFIFWGFIIYFSLKCFNRVYERMF